MFRRTPCSTRNIACSIRNTARTLAGGNALGPPLALGVRMPKPTTCTAHDEAVNPTRAQRRRAERLLRRGEARKAILMLRENAAREPSGATYAWLADGLLRLGKRDEALAALKQALYCFRDTASRGRARAITRFILTLDPQFRFSRKQVA